MINEVEIAAEAYKKAKGYPPDKEPKAKLTSEQEANLKRIADEMFE